MRPGEDQEVFSAGRKYVVTIYSGKIVRLYDLGARSVSKPRKWIAGIAEDGGKDERGAPFK